MPNLRIITATLFLFFLVGLGYIAMARSDVKQIDAPWLHNLVECAAINPDTEVIADDIIARTGCKANIDELGIELPEAIAILDNAGDRGKDSALSWAIPFSHQGTSYTVYCAIAGSAPGEGKSISCMSVQRVGA